MTLQWVEAVLRGMLIVLLGTACAGRAQQQAGPAEPRGSAMPASPATSSAHDQVVDVFASNSKSGAPDLTLGREDLQLLDEGRPVPTASFHAPGAAGQRPVVLWVVVQCTMPGTTSDGSGFLRKYTTEIASGLTKLSPGEAFGVAHWCDDGAAKLDVMPGRRIAQLGPALAGILAPTVTPPSSGLPGEHALLKLVHDIMTATAAYSQDAEPTLLFLYGDHSAAAAEEVNAILRELIAVPATVFLVNDGLVKPPSAYLGEVTRVIGNLAERTGGGYFHVPFGDTDPFLYARAIAMVIEKMHSRYQICWMPRSSDGDEHILAVRLSPSARKAHPGLEIRYRTVYETVRGPAVAKSGIR